MLYLYLKDLKFIEKIIRYREKREKFNYKRGYIVFIILIVKSSLLIFLFFLIKIIFFSY